MASEIIFDAGPGLTGITAYFLLTNKSGQRFNTAGAAFENYNAANITDYDIDLTEQGASGMFVGNMPSGIGGGLYTVTVKQRAGGSSAISDTRIGGGVIDWSGSIGGSVIDGIVSGCTQALAGWGVLSTADVATIVNFIWTDTTTADFTVAGSIGKSLFTSGIAPGSAGGHFIAGTNAATAVTTSFTTTFIGNLTGSVNSVATGVTVTTNNDKTGYGLSASAVQAIWDALTSALTTSGSIGKRLVDFVTTLVYVAPTTPPTAVSIAAAVWQDAVAGDFTVSGSIGKSIMNGVALGTGLTINGYTGNTPQTGDSYVIVNSATFGNSAINTKIGNPASTVSADIAAVKTDTGNLITRIPAALFNGITSLAKWFGIIAGKTADSGTLAEVNATTAGAGYANTTDSLEAIRDHGDTAWVTASSVTVSDKTGFKLANDGLALVTSWTVAITGNISGTVGGIAGTTQTLDALQTALSLAHGGGSWSTATGFLTLAGWQAATLPHSTKTYGNAMELIVSAIGNGLSSGAASSGTQTWVLRNLNDTADLISMTNDGLGNRSFITWNPS